MNLLNIRALPNKGANVEIVGGSNGSSHLRISLANLQDSKAPRLTGYGGPPNPYESDRFTPETSSLSDPKRRVFLETDPSCAVAASTLDEFATNQRAVTAAVADGNLSQLAQRNALAAAGIGFVAAAGSHYAKLQGISSNLDKTQAALYSPPEADSAGVVIDTEARSEFRKMSTDGQLSLLRDIGSPKMARLLLALKRTPIPWSHEGISDLVEKSWSKYVAAQRPQEVAQYQSARANSDWAKGLVGTLAHATMDAYGLDGFTVYQALKPTGGIGVVPFDTGVIQRFEHRLARVAA